MDSDPYAYTLSKAVNREKPVGGQKPTISCLRTKLPPAQLPPDVEVVERPDLAPVVVRWVVELASGLISPSQHYSDRPSINQTHERPIHKTHRHVRVRRHVRLLLRGGGPGELLAGRRSVARRLRMF